MSGRTVFGDGAFTSGAALRREIEAVVGLNPIPWRVNPERLNTGRRAQLSLSVWKMAYIL
jgi:hypothetical protein